jgi:hypothetical protein
MMVLLKSDDIQAMIDSRGQRLFVLLYANSQPRIGTYIALAKAIQDFGHIAVVIIPKAVRLESEELVGFESVVFSVLLEDQINRLRGVNLFFCSEVLYDVAPAGAVNVCILHSIPDAGLGAKKLHSNPAQFIENNPTMIRTFDYVVVAVRQSPTDWKKENFSLVQDLYPPEFLAGRLSTIEIIPGGYPKLDYSRRILTSPGPLDCIIYSPTACHVSFGRMRIEGETILQTLLQAFPNMKIVLRPYPTPADVAYGQSLADRLVENKNLIFDCSTTGITYQRRAAVSVTDSSSSAITFALATLRPLVFVNLQERCDETSPEQVIFGYRARSVNSLVQAVKACLEDSVVWKQKITEQAELSIYNPGSAAAYLAKHLSKMAEGRSNPDWLSVERRAWMPTRNSELQVQTHLLKLDTWRKKAPTKRTEITYKEIVNYLKRNQDDDLNSV